MRRTVASMLPLGTLACSSGKAGRVDLGALARCCVTTTPEADDDADASPTNPHTLCAVFADMNGDNRNDGAIADLAAKQPEMVHAA